jgi:sensor histidine kinase YesM
MESGGTSNKCSLKKRFTRFFVVFIISLILTIVLSNLNSYSSLQSYNQSFFLFDKITQFYTSVENMNQFYIGYIYNRDLNAYRGYLEEHEAVIRILDSLSSEKDDGFEFRIGLLRNMIATYHEHVLARAENPHELNDQQDYEIFQRLTFLIMDTYPEYSRLITKKMQQEKQRLSDKWREQVFLSFSLSFLLMLSSMIFSFSSLKSLTQPIDRIIKNIGKIKKGDFAISDIESNCAETDILVNAFAEMAIDLNRYVMELQKKSAIEKRLIEQENENLRISKMLAENRFSALQRQMNPHFLFNTLSMISKLAYIEGAEKTSNLMVRTSNLLRYSLDMSSRESNLDLEIQSVRDYFEIQKVRVGDRIQFILENQGEEDFPEVSIPGMILQPLIENSVLHGLKDKTEGAFVAVRIDRMQDRIRIVIEDNGIGMSSKQVDQLNSTVIDDTTGSSIGLANVKKRLGYFYKDNFRFTIESEEECGVVLTLEIPRQIGER